MTSTTPSTVLRGPSAGDAVDFEGVDASVEIASVPDVQPDREIGHWTIVDQYGEEHVVEGDGEGGWTIVVPSLR